MATPDDHRNLAYSTVATAPSPATSGTSLVVAAGEGTRFPSVSFNATIWPASAIPTPANAEIVRVTAIATDTFTITRIQEGTSARTVIVGDQIAATITDKTLTDIETHLVAPTKQVLTVGSGTYTTPANCTAILVEVVAGGGAGGGCAGSATQAGCGSGGASGGYARKLIAAPDATYAYTVGAKGSGGAGDGGAGSDSTFGAGGGLITTKGGGGGFGGALGTTSLVNSSWAGGLHGGASTGGDLNASGMDGSVAFRTAATASGGGSGAPSFFGGGGARAAGNTAGSAAVSPGAGGSGGRVESQNTVRNGGDGADGVIFVWEFYD